jgi:hypothetical protein
MTHKIAFIPHKTRNNEIIAYLKIINGALNLSNYKGDEDIDGAFYVKDEKYPNSRRTRPIITTATIDYLIDNNYDIYTIEEYEESRWRYERYKNIWWNFYPEYNLEMLLSNNEKKDYIMCCPQIVLTDNGDIKKYIN